MSRRKKVIILLDSLLIAFVILMVGYWIVKSASNTLIRVDIIAISATIQASPSPQPPAIQTSIHFSMRSDKSCYVVQEPIEVWTELVNRSDEPITVMKAIHLFPSRTLYGLDPIVNGKINKAHVTAIDRGDPSDDYVTLLPGEGSLIRIPDFLFLISDLDGQPHDSGTGQFEFALRYKNWIPYVLDVFQFRGNRYMYQVYGDRPVWTGLLESNALTITIAAHSAACGATSP